MMNKFLITLLLVLSGQDAFADGGFFRAYSSAIATQSAVVGGSDPDAILIMPMTTAAQFTDVSTGGVGSPHAETVLGDTQISSAIADPFGGSADVGLFDGTGDYITFEDSNDWDAVNSMTFTIEIYARFDTNNTVENIIGQTNGTTGYWWMYYHGGVSQLRFLGAGPGTTEYCYASWVPTVNTWYHIAIVYDSGTPTFYVDGVLKSTTHPNTQGIPAIAGKLQVGAGDQVLGTDPFDGYLANLKFSKTAKNPADFPPSGYYE